MFDNFNQFDTNYIGKVLIASLFIGSALNTIMSKDNFNGFKQMIANTITVEFAFILAILVIALKIIASTTIVFSNDQSKINIAAYSLIAFTIVVSVIYHNAWSDSSQLTNLLKNTAVVGGLMLIVK